MLEHTFRSDGSQINVIKNLVENHTCRCKRLKVSQSLYAFQFLSVWQCLLLDRASLFAIGLFSKRLIEKRCKGLLDVLNKRVAGTVANKFSYQQDAPEDLHVKIYSCKDLSKLFMKHFCKSAYKTTQ